MTDTGKRVQMGGAPRTRRLRAALLASTTLAIIGLAASSSGASAQVPQYWKGCAPTPLGGGGTWTASNLSWADVNGHNATTWMGADGVFTGTAGTVTVLGGQAFQSLRFSVNGYLIFDGGGGSLTTSGSATLQADSLVTATIDAPITGTGGVTKTGTGTIDLSDANTYSGATTVAAGTLQAGAASAFSASSSHLVDSAGTLDLAGFNQTIGSLANGPNGGGMVTTSSGSATLITGGDGSNTGFSGSLIDGEGSPLALTKTGSGTFTLSGSGNSYSGTTIISGGTLQGGATNAFSQNSVVNIAGVAAGTAATLDLGSFDQTIAGLNDGFPSFGTRPLSNTSPLRDGPNPGSDTVSLGANTLTIQTTAESVNAYSGSITGTGGVTISGSGEQDFGVVAYTGATQITDSARVAALAQDVFATSSSLTIGNNANFDMGGFNQSLKGLNGASPTATITNNTSHICECDLVVSPATLTVGASGNANSSFAGSITDGQATNSFTTAPNVVSLTKTGTRTFTLSGTNTYSGATQVNAGTLVVNGSINPANPSDPNANPSVTVASGGTLTGGGSLFVPVTVQSGGSLAGTAGQTLTMSSLVLNSGSNVNVALGSTTAKVLFGVTGNLTLGGTLNDTSITTPQSGVYHIFNYGGSLFNLTGLAVGTLPGGVTGTISTANANQVNLVVVGSSPTLQFWHPGVSGFGGNGFWNASNTNWTDQNGANPASWGRVQGIFQGTPGTVSVSGQQAFQTLEFVTSGYQIVDGEGGLTTSGAGTLWAEGAGTTATIATQLSGSGAVTKIGAGTISLTRNNFYSGGTFINAGTLSIQQDANLGAASGGVNLNGGTLQFAGSFGLQATRAIALGMLGGTFDTQGFNDSIAGNLGDGTGAHGSLTKIGTGTLALSGANTYSGATFVNAGTLRAGGASAFSKASAFTVAPGATLDLNSFNQTIGSLAGSGAVTLGLASLTTGADNSSTSFSGMISGSGGLGKIGTGTLTLSGVNGYSGGTNIQTGAISITNPGALGSGTVALQEGAALNLLGSFTFGNMITIAGDPTFEVDGTNVSTFSGVIADGTTPGTLVKTGTGTLTLSAIDTYSGPTTVAAGTLNITGSIANSSVTIGSGGTLAGSGTVGSLVVQNGAKLAPGALTPFTTLGVAGNASFAAGSTYAVNVNAQGQNDFTRVTGRTTISGGTVNVIAANGTYQPATIYRILTSGGGVSGAFSNATSNLAFLDPTLSYDANNVFLTLLRNDINFQAAAQPGNPATVALALQNASVQLGQRLLQSNGSAVAFALANGGVFSSAGLTIINRIENLTAANANLAFNSLSGEGANAAPEASFLTSRLFSSAMLSQSAFWRNGGGSDANGLSSNELSASEALGYAPIDDQHIAPFDKMGGKQMAFLQAPLPRTWRIWFTGLGGLEQLPGQAANGIAKSSARAYGGAGGIDYQINQNFLVGFAAGGTNGSFSTKERLTQGTEGGMHIGVYGTANFGHFYATTTLDGGYFNDHLKRSVIGLGATELTNGSLTETELGGRLEVGWKQSFGNFKVTPFAALEARRIGMPAFTEQSALADGTPGIFALSYRSQSLNSVRSFLGANLETPFEFGNGMTLTPNLRVAWVHEFDRTRRVGAFLENLPEAAFAINGARPPREALETSLGAQLGVTQSVKLFANFDGDFYSGGHSYAAMAGLKIIFDELPRAAAPGLAGSAPIFSSREAAKVEEDALFPRVVREPQNLDLSFHFAEVASAAGDYEAAVGALERMRFYNTDLPRVELELGVLYFRLGSYKMALSHFEAAVSAPDTPEEVRQRVAEFEREIAKRLSPNQFTLYAQTGLRYQTNANAGPNNVLVKALGQDAVLDSQFTRKGDWNAFGLASAHHFYDFGDQRGDGWQTDVNAYYAHQFKVTRLNLGIAEVQTGPRLGVAPDSWPGLTFHPYVIGNAASLGDNPYLRTFGVGAALDYTINGDFTVEPSIEFRHRDYYNSTDYQSAKDQTGNLVNVALSATGPISTSVRWQARTLFADATAKRTFDAYRQFGVDFGLPIDFNAPFLSEPRVWTATPMAGYSLVRYGGPNFLIDPNVTRQDGEWHAGISLDAPITSSLGFGTQIMFQRVNSTLRNYDTRNFSISAGPTVRF